MNVMCIASLCCNLADFSLCLCLFGSSDGNLAFLAFVRHYQFDFLSFVMNHYASIYQLHLLWLKLLVLTGFCANQALWQPQFDKLEPITTCDLEKKSAWCFLWWTCYFQDLKQ